MSQKINAWCAVLGCTQEFNWEKRNFLRFPKEHNRFDVDTLIIS